MEEICFYLLFVTSKINIPILSGSVKDLSRKTHRPNLTD